MLTLNFTLNEISFAIEAPDKFFRATIGPGENLLQAVSREIDFDNNES